MKKIKTCVKYLKFIITTTLSTIFIFTPKVYFQKYLFSWNRKILFFRYSYFLICIPSIIMSIKTFAKIKKFETCVKYYQFAITITLSSIFLFTPKIYFKKYLFLWNIQILSFQYSNFLICIRSIILSDIIIFAKIKKVEKMLKLV